MDMRTLEPGELDLLARFRYEIYVDEMQRTQRYADHEGRRIIDPHDATATNFVAEARGTILGTVRVNFCRDGGIDAYEDFYEVPQDPEHRLRASITTRLMVAAQHRGGALSLRLATQAYVFGLYRGITHNYIDCNDHLKPLFARLGYDELFTKYHSEYGNVACLRLPLLDREKLVRRGSPFVRQLDRFLAKQANTIQQETLTV